MVQGSGNVFLATVPPYTEQRSLKKVGDAPLFGISDTI